MREATPEELRTKRMIIYMIRNKVNGKVYIGQTVRTFNERYAGAGVGVERINKDNTNTYLINSLNKHGLDNFSVHILEHDVESVDVLNELEEYWISKHKSYDQKLGYNMQIGGNNHSISSQEKIRKLTREYVSYLTILREHFETSYVKSHVFHTDDFYKICFLILGKSNVKYKAHIKRDLKSREDILWMKHDSSVPLHIAINYCNELINHIDDDKWYENDCDYETIDEFYIKLFQINIY